MSTPELNFEERLLYVTRHLVQYSGYGNDIRKASKVVHKYFKDKTLDACQVSLECYANAYKDGILFVETHKAIYWMKDKPASWMETETEFLRKHPDVPGWAVRAMLSGIFNWYHER